ncbi:hypothetical protein MKX07_003917 [Trichoderma sp. CBMAI-0711]|nr:hypothetical protein MKX07_003917 [Trichoderma sp. CBMAI-0711]
MVRGALEKPPIEPNTGDARLCKWRSAHASAEAEKADDGWEVSDGLKAIVWTAAEPVNQPEPTVNELLLWASG